VAQDLKRLLPSSFPLPQAAFAVAATLALSACNSDSITDTLRPTASVSAPVPGATVGNQTALAAEERPSAPAAQLGQQQAALGRIPPVAFLPVTGAPQSVVTQLAGAMRSAAQSNSVPVVVSVERGARYQVKGYFSALSDNSGTMLVYVWDVLDANGVRVHRISGQERGSSSSGDPWSGVNSDVIDRVARNTMSGLKSWASSRTSG